ncbi:MAG: hypothetical protein ACR2G4_18115 [Pyrinomonadaceae bacterium]
MKNHRDSNQLLVRFLLLPTIFLTVALLGGLRVDAATRAFLFITPPLVTLVLAALLMFLFVRGQLVDLRAWLSGDHAPLANISHALTLAALFCASAQAFNSVLPERGLFRWMFACFFLWTLWNNQFAVFDARRLLRSLAALFGTAFVLKHMLLANLYAPEGGWWQRIAGALLEGITQGTFGAPESFAPATGYISFFTLALYVAGLIILLPFAPLVDAQGRELTAHGLVTKYHQLSPEERLLVRTEILRKRQGQLGGEAQLLDEKAS